MRAALEPEPPTDYHGDMISAVVSRQVRAGGVDTPGTRAEAERWCAMLCGCVCDGMRATTDASAYRVTWSDLEYDDDDGERFGLSNKGALELLNAGGCTPLGKP